MPDLDPVEPPANPEFEIDSTPDEASTVGTGSFIAIGCSVIVLIILFIGIALFVSRQVN